MQILQLPDSFAPITCLLSWSVHMVDEVQPVTCWLHAAGTSSATPLPPPAGPPPGFAASHLPPPTGPPPGMMMHQLPTPMMPPPGYGMMMPPPPGAKPLTAPWT